MLSARWRAGQAEPARGAVAQWGRGLELQHVAQHEERRHDVERGADVAPTAAEGLDERVGDETQRHAFGDVVGENHHDHGHEGRKGFGDVVEIDILDRTEHEHAHQHEGTGGGGRRNEQEEGGEEEGHGEEQTGGEGGHAGAAAFGDAGATFDESCDCRGAEHGAYGGADGVGHECFLHVFHVALGVHHLRVGGGADERADGVENVHEHEREDGERHVGVEERLEVELQERGGDGLGHRQGREAFGDNGHTQGNADEGAGGNAVEKGTAHAEFHQYATEHYAEHGERRHGGEGAERNEGGGIGYDDARVLQTDEGDEKADARRDGEAKGLRDAVDNLLAHVEGREQDEDDALNKDGGERRLPAVAHTGHEGEGKEGIDAHAGGLGEGQLGEECDEHRAECRSQGGGGEHGAFVHAGRGEDVGVDGEDVAHGQEGGETGHEFGAEVVLRGVETQETIERLHEWGSELGEVMSRKRDVRAERRRPPSGGRSGARMGGASVTAPCRKIDGTPPRGAKR